MFMIRKDLRAAAACIWAALVLSAICSPARAQDWPTRAVKFVLPIGAGSGADIGARLIAEKLSARWGQPVVVENRPGGDGFVALTGFTSGRDDHTLLYAPATTFTGHPYLHDKLPYNPGVLVPIVRVSSTLISIGAPPSFAASLKDMFDKARAEPGKLNWTTTAGATDLIIRAFFKKAGLDLVRVPYRDPIQGQNDVAEGRVHLYWSAYAIVQAQAQAGRIKVLAITSSEPTAILPGVPTVAQAGSPDLTFDGLIGLFSTRDTLPAAVRERIGADVRAVLDDPAIVQRLTATGQTVVPGTAADFAAAIDRQRSALADFAKVLGIKAATIE